MSTSSQLVANFETLVRALNSIIFGRDDETVTLDGIVKPTISKEIADRISDLYDALGAVSGGYFKSYATLEEANSDILNIPMNTSVKVLSEEDGGDYYRGSEADTSLTKSKYDPLTISKNYSNTLNTHNQEAIKNLHLSLQKMNSVVNEICNDMSNKESEKLNLLITMQLLMSEVGNLKSSTGLPSSYYIEPVYQNNYVVGEPKGLIILDFVTESNNLPTAKGTVLNGDLKINIDGQILKCFCTFEVQGSGSAAYPKKNWTFGLYSDSTHNNEVNLSIGTTLMQQEWVFKSNYTDKAQVRNLLNYNLWEEFLKKRSGPYPVRDIDNSYLGLSGDVVYTKATSFPTGFNCVLNINGSFYGIGQFMIGKKRENYNMSKSDDSRILIGLDNLPGFRVDTLADGTYELRSPSKPTNNTRAIISNWSSFAKSGQSEFTAAKSARMSTRNVVDFYIYSQFIGNIDGITNNTHMATWDGVKWFFLPYDMDLTFKDFRMSADNTDVFSYGGNNLEFWNKVKTAYLTEMKARYGYLRSSGVLTVSNMRNMYLDISEKFTKDLHDAELSKWNNRETTSPYGGGEVSKYNVNEFCSWVERRIVYMDQIFSYVQS